MATNTYDSFLVALANGTINLATADLRAVLVTSGYTFDRTHDWLSDVVAGNRVGSPVALDPQTVAAHAEGASFDLGDVTFTGLDGTTAVACIWYVHNAAEGAAQLCAYHKLAVPSAGSEIVVRWPAGPDYVLALKGKPSFQITGVALTDVITTDQAHNLSPGAAVAVSGLTGGVGLTAGNYLVATTPLSTTLTLTGVDFSTDITAGTLQVLS